MIHRETLVGLSPHERFRVALSQLEPGNVVIDCGANVGTVTRQFRKRGCTVHAFEPDPIACSTLRQAFRNDESVLIHQAAVGTKNGYAKLYFHPGRDKELVYTQSSSLNADKRNVSVSRFALVKVVELASFLQTLGRGIAILKIDIEGSEAEVLLAIIRRGLYDHFDCAFIETHESKVPSTRLPMQKVRAEMERLKLKHIFLDWH